ncbi:MAG: hypothetical protein CL885_02460 [Dehalococcoidia bacterium]|nr:hypothetical protein [Dehalococcoidia bacterium]
MASTANYRRAFRDIVRGFSTSELNGELVYIKHLSPHDQVELEDLTEFYKNEAESRGLPTNEDMLELLREQGDWTEADENEIKKIESFIETLQAAKSKLILKSAMDNQDRIINKERERLALKKRERADLIGRTCEVYADDRTHDFYILKSFFKDVGVSNPLWSNDEYDELTRDEIAKVVYVYNNSFEFFSEESIQHLVLTDFYQPYLGFADDSMQFYGLPFCQLTYNQIRMIVYTRIFKSIYENNQNIPDKIKNDPKALLDYGSISDEEKEKMKEKFNEGDGSTLVGASDEDYEYLGLRKPDSGISLHEEAKKKGGSLSMQDLMKLSGTK